MTVIKDTTFIKLSEDATESYTDDLIWLLDILKSGETFYIPDITIRSEKDISTVRNSAETLWKAGIIDTVTSYLAIGILKDKSWHINFIIDDAQEVADLLAKENNNVYPEVIHIIRNGVDGPVIKKLNNWFDKTNINIDLLQKIWDEQSIFSQKTFGSDEIKGPIGSLKHLEKEVKEVQEHPDDLEEYVDCFLLLLDATRRSKNSLLDLLSTAYCKLQKNKKRKWPPIDKNNLDVDVGHIKEELS